MGPERAYADTNLFLRFLTNDVPSQAEAVEQLLRRAAGGEVVLVVNTLVIAEIVWTLESYYGLARSDVKSKIFAIINTPGVEVPERELVLRAISWHADMNVDFADAFDAAWLLDRGLITVYTFDEKHFSRIEGIRVRVPAR